MNTSRLTVVTPSFNQGPYIEKTLDSVLSQGYPDLEYIVIDGGSTDNSVDIIRKYEKHLTYWVSEKDRGQSHALNKGLSRATGDILTWLNSDDWYLPGALAEMADMLQRNPEAGMVVGAGRNVDVKGRETYFKAPTSTIDVESLYRWSLGGNFLQPSSAFRRSAWELAGPLDENVHIAMDLDLWLRMAKKGVKFVTTNTVLSEALVHPDAKTTAFQELMALDCSIVVIRHGGEGVVRPILEQMINNYVDVKARYREMAANPITRWTHKIAKRLVPPSKGSSKQQPSWLQH